MKPLVGGVLASLAIGVLAASALTLVAQAQSQSQAQMQAQAPAPAPPRGAPPDLALGETRYRERCAGCHENASGRTPGRAAISDNTATFIAATMREGVMKPMAEGLSRNEIGAIAAYLARKSGGDVDVSALETPLCNVRPKPLTLSGPQWNGWGRTGENPRYQPDPGLKASDVPRLKVKWAFGYSGGRNGQATVVGDRLFVNSSAGSVYSLDPRTGCAHWRFNAEGGTRSSITVGALPASAGPAKFAAYFTDSTRHAYAIDAETGRLLWKTYVDSHPGVQMTGSPTLHAGRLYVPVSSAEEAIATNDSYECCTFRGSLVALDAITGKQLWKTYTTATAPKPFKKNAKGVQMHGPAGGAIWSAPTIDAKRKLVYVATGDSYTDVEYDGSDAIIAFDMDTGAIRWVNQLTKGDNYIIGCNPKRGPVGANCPTVVGPDYDFGASPILHTLPGGKQLILAGQKSSEVYALDPDRAGKVIWKHRLSIGGALGGIEFGPAIDGENIYAAVADIYVPEGGQARPGITAIRIRDGKILWHTPAPAPAKCRWTNVYCHPAMSQAITAIPGAVFSGAMDGHFRAFHSKTGKIIWDFDTGAGLHRTTSGREVEGGVMDGAGPTVVGGMVYVHSGYQSRSGGAGNVLLAFSVDGR